MNKKIKDFTISFFILMSFGITGIEVVIGFVTLGLYQKLFPVGFGQKLLRHIQKKTY